MGAVAGRVTAVKWVEGGLRLLAGDAKGNVVEMEGRMGMGVVRITC